MYDKLKMIKMCISTILLALLLISVFKSCSYAFTWNDLVDHCKNINNSLTTNTTAKNQANKIVQYQQTYLNLIANGRL